MKDFLNQIEVVLIDLWNYLYRFLAHILNQEVNDDWIVEPPVKN